jgi:uncharacterized protein YydD (DUF2326 family)
MKLSRLYTNNDEIFSPINFNEGLNVVQASVQHPKDDDKSSHCLGKNLLIDVIDFCLLKAVGKKGHFLKTRDDLFSSLVFFLEIQLNAGGFVTVRRPVLESTKISFKRHSERHQDFSASPDRDWDHLKVTLRAACTMLDGYLELSAIKPWPYRKGVSYFMRKQEDYANEFQLRKYMSSTHRSWKPYVARVLGLNETPLVDKYLADAEFENLKARRDELQREATVKVTDYEKLRASITVKKDEVEQKVSSLDKFDFKEQESGLSQELAYGHL